LEGLGYGGWRSFSDCAASGPVAGGRFQVRRGRLVFVSEVRSLTHVLGQTVGRTFRQPATPRSTMRAAGVDMEDPAFKGTGAVIDLLRDRAFTASGLGGFASGWFTFGTLEWTSGGNAGRRT